MRRSSMLILGLASATLGAAAPLKPQPQGFEATVERVVDGDTLAVVPLRGGAAMVVRLEGIDAPERCQDGGVQATAALRALVQGQTLRVQGRVRDDWGRLVARVWVGDVDVGDRLVRDGMAWSQRVRHDRGPYVAEERMAQALRRGVHAQADAVMPRVFRQQHGPCETGGAASAPAAPK